MSFELSGLNLFWLTLCSETLTSLKVSVLVYWPKCSAAKHTLELGAYTGPPYILEPVSLQVSSIHRAVEIPQPDKSLNVTPHLILRASTSSPKHMVDVDFKEPIVTALIVPLAITNACLPLKASGSKISKRSWRNWPTMLLSSWMPSSDRYTPVQPESESQS